MNYLCLLLLLLFSITTYGQKDRVNTDTLIYKQGRGAVDSIQKKAYEARVNLDYIDGNYIPRDLYDCFKQLDKLMDNDVRERFMEFSDEEVDRKTHGSLGIWLDNKWSLTEGSRLSKYFRDMKIPHPNYMVGIIIQSYHRYLNKRDLKLKEQVEFFRKDWEVKRKARRQKILEHVGFSNE